MRKIIIFGCLMLCRLMVQADTYSMLEISGGGGWSTMTYNLTGNTSTTQTSFSIPGSYNFTVHAAYGFFFNRYVGLGLGVDLSRYGGAAAISGNMRWNDVTDSDGEKYNHLLTINRWQDKQEIYYLEVPLTLYIAFPLAHHLDFSAEIGVKYAYPFLSKAVYAGEVEHQGEYPQWGMTIKDMPNHGFETKHLEGTGSFIPQQNFIAFAKVGVEFPIAKRIAFFTHVYATCGFKKALKAEAEEHELGFREDTDAAAALMPFMSTYTPLINTQMAKGSFLPVSVGLEVGLRFFFPHTQRSHHPCRCLDDD